MTTKAKKITKRKKTKKTTRTNKKSKLFTQYDQMPSMNRLKDKRRDPEFIKQIDEYVKMREDEPLSAAIKKMYN